MSRTYRFKKDPWMIEYYSILVDWNYYKYYLTKFYISKDSVEGRKKIAKFCSDSKRGFCDYKGPSAFHNINQRSYRTLVKEEICKYYKDPEYEIQLLRKPYREYWT